VLLSHHNLAVAERARDTALVHLQHARARLQGGVGNRLDEVRAAQEAATTEAQVQTARTSLTRAQEALGLLAGADGPLDAADDGAAPIDSHPRVDGRYPLPAAPPLPQALAEAQRRSDVRAQEARAEALERARRNSFTDYLPLLAGVFQPFFLYPAIGVQPPAGWQAQLILTVPLYDGGLRYGQRRERAALSAQARVQLEAVLRQARADVRVAVTAAERADQALRAAQEAARLAGESLKLADLAYRAGATTNLEVIDAERRARDAESAAELAADTARQARLELLIASGRFP
jgi:outer membrane protein TolC